MSDHRVSVGVVGSGVNWNITDSGSLSFSPAPLQMFSWNMATGQNVAYDFPVVALEGVYGGLSAAVAVVAPVNNNSADLRLDYSVGNFAKVSGSETYAIDNDGISNPNSEAPEIGFEYGFGGHTSVFGFVVGAAAEINSDQGIVFTISP